MTNLELDDIKLIADLPYHWNILNNKIIMISGGTGFIGTLLINVFRYRNEKYNSNIKVISLSRRGGISDNTVQQISADITKPINYNGHIDYILHLASNTHPKQYADDPVGTITTNVIGCNNLLQYAVEKNIQRFLLASSVEIYGQGSEIPMNETYCGYIDCNKARSGYNEAKRTCEALCQSYSQQYHIDSVIVRLARIIGADVKEDTKAMAQFMTKAVHGENIVLKSEGKQRYSYCYVADAVSGIIKILLDGKTCEAYNISALDDGMTLGQYAEFIAALSNKKVDYQIEYNANASSATYALLDIEKISRLGWKPCFNIKDALQRTYSIYKSRT